MANFESPNPKDETDSKVNDNGKKEDFLNGQQAKGISAYSAPIKRNGFDYFKTLGFPLFYSTRLIDYLSVVNIIVSIKR